MIPLYDNSSTNNGNETGKCIGVSMVILLTLTLPLNYFTFIYTIDVLASLSFICVLIVLILSGVLVGGCCCCCKKRYNFEPRVRNWSIAVFCGTLAYTVLWMLWLLTWIDVYPSVQIASAVLSYAFLLEALVFSVFFTWGRGWKK